MNSHRMNNNMKELIGLELIKEIYEATQDELPLTAREYRIYKELLDKLELKVAAIKELLKRKYNKQ